MTTLYNHPRLGRVTVGMRYEDVWIVTTQDGAIENVSPSALTPIGIPDQRALPEVVDVQVTDVTQIKINHCPRQLADAIDGVGMARAGKILNRKPEGGYADYEQLEGLNPDVGVNWADVIEQDRIDFEPI